MPYTCKLGTCKNELCKYGSFSLVNIIISYCREVIYIIKLFARKPLALNMTHYNNKNNNEIRH